MHEAGRRANATRVIASYAEGACGGGERTTRRWAVRVFMPSLSNAPPWSGRVASCSSSALAIHALSLAGQAPQCCISACAERSVDGATDYEQHERGAPRIRSLPCTPSPVRAYVCFLVEGRQYDATREARRAGGTPGTRAWHAPAISRLDVRPGSRGRLVGGGAAVRTLGALHASALTIRLQLA